MGKIDYSFMCPTCGKAHDVQMEVPDDKLERLEAGTLELKDALRPGTFDREILISGMCYDCQEKVFHRPAPGHEAEWGDIMSECPICGTPLYKRDVEEDKCPSCHCILSKAEEELEEEEYEDEE